MVFAPAATDSYASAAFPGITDALYDISDSDEAAWEKVKVSSSYVDYINALLGIIISSVIDKSTKRSKRQYNCFVTLFSKHIILDCSVGLNTVSCGQTFITDSCPPFKT